jgi:hypothetical protein
LKPPKYKISINTGKFSGLLSFSGPASERRVLGRRKLGAEIRPRVPSGRPKDKHCEGFGIEFKGFLQTRQKLILNNALRVLFLVGHLANGAVPT